MSLLFSAVLLAGGRSTRMGRDKALIPIDGVPMWERQLSIVEQLAPAQVFLAGPPRAQWDATRYAVIDDAAPDAGPLGGIVAALRCCNTSRLLALAVDLPNITAAYLQELLARSSSDVGIVPGNGDYLEPVAAIYPTRCLLAAEDALQRGVHSLQRFAARGVAEGWLTERLVAAEDAPLFLNMNTPDDLAVVVRQHV